MNHAKASPATPTTILICGDTALQTIGPMLSAFGYDVVTARNVREARSHIEEKVPGLVLLEDGGGGFGGLSVLKSLRRVPGFSDVPVIFFSFNYNENRLVQALEAGAVDYLTQPLNKAEWIARIRTHLKLKSVRDETAEQLAAAEEFLDTMAHDLKNWIGSAQLNAMLLSESLHNEDLDSKARCLNSIEEAAGKALVFIEEFLSNRRHSENELELNIQSFDLIRLCSEIGQAFESEAADKGIQLEYPCHLKQNGGAAMVKSDRLASGRILENLISNAIKFSPKDRRVMISVIDRQFEKVVFVADEGPGFTDEDLDHLFRPYERLSASPTDGEISTGLGLSIVKRLCDHLDVKIDVQTGIEGKGACMVLHFPADASLPLSDKTRKPSRQKTKPQHDNQLAYDRHNQTKEKQLLLE